MKSKGKSVASAFQRKAKLVHRLVKEGVSKTDAWDWEIKPVTPETKQHAFQDFDYTHPRVPGHFTGLTPAKEAHLREREKIHIVFAEGTPQAASVLQHAQWKDMEENNLAEAIGSTHSHLLQVVLVDTAPFIAISKQVLDRNWNAAALAGLGFLLISKPSVILDRDTFRVLGVFLTGDMVPELVNLAPKLPDIHTLLSQCMNYMKDRPDLYMFGFRNNKYEKQTGNNNLRTSYYCAKGVRKAIDMYRNAAAKSLIMDVGSTMCGLERLVCPAMGEHRTQHGKLSGHPGLWPGTSIARCSAACIGASRSYASTVHDDEGHKNMAETIAWFTKGVPLGSGYCFAVADAGIMFDLLACGGTPMVMVPGSVRHGTPNLNAGFDPNHPGVGVVIVSKANLTTPEARAGTKIICERIKEQKVFATCNPFMSRFAIADFAKCVCEHCHLAKETPCNLLFLCDVCNRACHARCVDPRPLEEDDEDWICPKCLPELQAAKRAKHGKKGKSCK